ncbi:unnamed protein product [Bemisia tabaci]|uniref:Uncharacterized protein n=1 Tax=Bemisia tabaci TaxID=7038 RepID=A0A9P0A0S9_BEMTA|nr:unnamed protein product [Bemisia tabaci]
MHRKLGDSATELASSPPFLAVATTVLNPTRRRDTPHGFQCSKRQSYVAVPITPPQSDYLIDTNPTMPYVLYDTLINSIERGTLRISSRLKGVRDKERRQSGIGRERHRGSGTSVGGPRESGNGVEWNGLERRSEEAKAVRSGGPRSAEPRNRRVSSEQWSEAGVMIPGFTLFWLPSPPTYLWMYEPVYHKPLHELTRVLIPVEPVVCPAAFLTFRAADMEARTSPHALRSRGRRSAVPHAGGGVARGMKVRDAFNENSERALRSVAALELAGSRRDCRTATIPAPAPTELNDLPVLLPPDPAVLSYPSAKTALSTSGSNP